MGKATVDLYEHFPVRAIADGCMVNGTLDVTAGFSLLLPEVYCMDQDFLAGMHAELSQLIKRMPVDGFIQLLGHYYQGPFQSEYTGASPIQRENFLRWQERPVSHSFVRAFVSFCNPGYRPKQTRSSLLSPFTSKESVFKKAEERIKAFQAFVPTFESSFSGLHGIKVKRMDDAALRGSLYDYWALQYHASRSGEEVMSRELPDIDITDGYFKVGDQYVCVVTMSEEGEKLHSEKLNTKLGRGIGGALPPQGVKIATSMPLPLTLGLPFNHLYSVGIRILDNVEQESANSGFRTLGLEVQKTLASKAAALKLAAKESFVTTLSEFHQQACLVHVAVVLHDNDLAKLKAKADYTVDAFKNMNDSFGRIEGHDLANVFWTTSPGNAMHNYRNFTETVEQGVSYLPKENQYYSDREGLIFKDRFGNPFTMNFWQSPHIKARNVIGFGPTGSGKSVGMNYIVDQLFVWGNIVVIIDKGGSYKWLVKTYGGLYVDSADRKSMRFNIFVCKKDAKGNYLYRATDGDGEGADDQVNFCYVVIRRIWKRDMPISGEEMTILKDIIDRFYRHVNASGMFPDMVAFSEYTLVYEKDVIADENRQFFNFQSLRLMLSPYTTGPEKELLNDQSGVSLAGNYRIYAFDLEEVAKNQEKFEIVSAIIMNLAVGIIERSGAQRKTIVLDEAIDFLQGSKSSGEPGLSDMADFVGAQYRKIRKANGQMCLLTQGASYLKYIHPIVRESILGNSDIKLLFDHSGKNVDLIDETVKLLGMTSFQEEQLRSLEQENGQNYRGALVIMGTYSKVVRLELTPYSYAVFNTDKEEKTKMQELFDKYGNVGAAINEYVYQREKKTHEKANVSL